MSELPEWCVKCKLPMNLTGERFSLVTNEYDRKGKPIPGAFATTKPVCETCATEWNEQMKRDYPE